MRSFSHILSQRWWLPAMVALGMALNVATLWTQPFADDFLQWAIFHGELPQAVKPGSLFGLFNLVDGQPASVQALKDSGRLLWCATGDLRLSFWRPLAELSHWVDYRLWPDVVPLMHLHSLLCYGALLWLLGHLYRQIDPHRARSGLALAIYALSSLHFFAIAWISARNQLLAACFSVTAITAYHHWRQGRGRRFGIGAFLFMGLSLASAEAGVATAGYLLAYGLTLDRSGPWRQRLGAIAPFLLLVLVWQVVCKLQGYGSQGSGSYIDPGAQPWRFIAALSWRMPSLLLAQLLGPSSAMPTTMDDQARTLYAAAGATVALMAAWVCHKLGLWRQPLARFHALGALLALVPVCAVASNDRLLINADIGMSGLLAMIFTQVLAQRRRQTEATRLHWSGTALVGLMALVHLAVFPVATVLSPLVWDKLMLPSTLGEPLSIQASDAQPDARVIVINPPTPGLMYYHPLARRYLGLPNPASIQALANGDNQGITLHVVDAFTLDLSSEQGFVDAINRDVDSQPFRPGDQVRMGHISVTVQTVSARGEPLSARFRFDEPLNHPQWRFYVWRPGRGDYVPITLPSVGNSLALRAPDIADEMNQRLHASSSTTLKVRKRHVAKQG
jgi:hypothetical protein